MKHLLHPRLSLALFALLLALSCGLGRAQAPVAERLDVYFGETKLLTVDGAIDSYAVTPDNILRVDKAEGSPNQLSLVGISSGSATLTVKSDGRTLVYDVAISRAPERLYINLDESKRLTFPGPVDDTSLSTAGIVRVVQPDFTVTPTTDLGSGAQQASNAVQPIPSANILLIEAKQVGKTTLTVYSKSEIYTYFISTFENRGADILEIQNDFSAKGYRNLTITFDKDQAIVGGTVPTQEELDDAVKIVKQFTQFVVVKANLGQAAEETEYTEQEQVIINNIQRIANVKGLTVRVKFPMPTVITTSSYIKSKGDYIEPATTTTPQGGVVKGSGFAPPPTNQQGPDGSGPTEPKQENTTETVTTTEDTSIPEKIFLYGDLDNDLDEAKALRVSRTFCPFVVNFITVKDPIQLRIQLRFMQVTKTTSRDTGVLWQGTSGTGPTVSLGILPITSPVTSVQDFVNLFTKGITGTVDASATLQLFESLGLAKVMRESELFLTNGQPGWYSEGEVKYYVSSSVTSTGFNPIQTVTATPLFLGLNMDISPLNIAIAGGVEPTGQKIYGVPTSVGGGTSDATVEQNSDPSPDKIGKVGKPIQLSGTAPVIDNTVKYVDENGLIGINISTQLTVPNGAFQSVNYGAAGQFVTLPDFFVRATRTRASLRDGQTVAIDGLVDAESSRNIVSLPFFSKIPLFSALFKNPVDNTVNQEIVVLVTPHIIRARDPDSSRYPRPASSEMEDLARANNLVPIIKPVRYDAEAVDIRPENPDTKDAKEVSDVTLPASPGTQGLLPPTDPSQTVTSMVDSKPAAPDNSRQPSSAPLAPSSTLP